MTYSSNSDVITRDYFDSILLESRYIDADLPDISFELFGERFSTPIMTEDQYGRGFLYILNIPDNYGDLYRLPREVIGAITKNFARKGQVYLTVNPKFSLFTYDNDTFCVYNLNEFKTPAEVTVLGEEYIGIEDLETGVQYTTPVRVNPRPKRTGDSATCRPEPLEQVFELNVMPGDWKCYKLLKK